MESLHVSVSIGSKRVGNVWEKPQNVFAQRYNGSATQHMNAVSVFSFYFVSTGNI